MNDQIQCSLNLSIPNFSLKAAKLLFRKQSNISSWKDFIFFQIRKNQLFVGRFWRNQSVLGAWSVWFSLKLIQTWSNTTKNVRTHWNETKIARCELERFFISLKSDKWDKKDYSSLSSTRMIHSIQLNRVVNQQIRCLRNTKDRKWPYSNNFMIESWFITHKLWVITNCAR